MDKNDHPDWTRAATAKLFLLERELAARWRISPRTLQRWRARKVAPTHHILGRRVLYAMEDVEDAEDAARSEEPEA